MNWDCLFGHKWTKTKRLPFIHKMQAGGIVFFDKTGEADVKVCFRCNSFRINFVSESAEPSNPSPVTPKLPEVTP